jgi:hypothetical protein
MGITAPLKHDSCLFYPICCVFCSNGFYGYAAIKSNRLQKKCVASFEFHITESTFSNLLTESGWQKREAGSGEQRSHEFLCQRANSPYHCEYSFSHSVSLSTHVTSGLWFHKTEKYCLTELTACIPTQVYRCFGWNYISILRVEN